MAQSFRLYFVTDLHASEVCYQKFLRAAEFYKASVLILGGDITGKMIIPIVSLQDGGWSAHLHGNDIKVGADGLSQLESRIRNAGYYPHRTTSSEAEELRSDPSKLDELFSTLMSDTVRRWVRTAEERFRGSNTQIYISPGNDDALRIDSILSSSDVVQNPEEKVVDIGGHEMLTLGTTNPTPWHTEREASEDELAKKIDALTGQVKRMETCIFNIHVPPSGTPLDLAMKLDDQLRPVMSGGEPDVIHVGSTSVRSAIERHKPLLGLHGHIHESRSTCKIGRTLCANPGSEYGEGVLRGALCEFGDGRLRYCLLTSG